MPWVCDACDSNHGSPCSTCDKCGSGEIQYVQYGHQTEHTAETPAQSPHDEFDVASAPDVATDGSLKENDDDWDTGNWAGGNGQSKTLKTGRSVAYKINAWIKAPFHIIRMYIHAILAFLIVFGGVAFLLL